ncbi:MAG: alcohol dehydrogenase catalytic domain-containing protein [Trueperaceae bacterium]|nr:alcohol dehydrogenase catalytic domain-containing protein [Trueperaceae bacterium]
MLAGHHPFVDYPVFTGHEIAAEVVAVDDDADDAWIGARAALEPSLVCGVCRNCRAGRYNICERLRVMGSRRPAGTSPYPPMQVGRRNVGMSQASLEVMASSRPSCLPSTTNDLPLTS